MHLLSGLMKMDVSPVRVSTDEVTSKEFLPEDRLMHVTMTFSPVRAQVEALY